MSIPLTDDTADIAVLDFSRFLSGDAEDKQTVADAMLQSFKDVGFVYLLNHGIPQDEVDSMFKWSKTFFDLPIGTKNLAPHPESGTHHRGYSSPGREKVVQNLYLPEEQATARKQAPDLKESFEMGREDDPVMPNIWLPDGVLPGFKEACLVFFWTCSRVELEILRALAIAFKLPETYFTDMHTAIDNQLRLLHYPPVTASDSEEISRIGAHSDFGSITLLFQDAVGGLEIEDPAAPGTFKPAVPIPGALVVNAGDFLMRWSNDMIKSTIHRVRSPPGLVCSDEVLPARYSIPYFCSTNFDTVVDCIPGTWDAMHVKKYEAISAGEYIMKRLAATY